MNKLQQKQLEVKIEEAVADYMTANGIQGKLEVSGGAIKMLIPRDTPNYKFHEQEVAVLVTETVSAFGVEHNLKFGCECGECSPAFNLREYLYSAVKSGLDSTTPEVTSDGKLDPTKQIDEAVNRVMYVLTAKGII